MHAIKHFFKNSLWREVLSLYLALSGAIVVQY